MRLLSGPPRAPGAKGTRTAIEKNDYTGWRDERAFARGHVTDIGLYTFLEVGWYLIQKNGLSGEPM